MLRILALAIGCLLIASATSAERTARRRAWMKAHLDVCLKPHGAAIGARSACPSKRVHSSVPVAELLG